MRRDERVTDEMVELACKAITEKRGFVWPDEFSEDEKQTGRENIRAALSAALSIEQTQPVAWMYQFKTNAPVLMVEKRNWAGTHSEWTETPLYAHPPTTRIADSAEAGGSATLSSGGAE